jgi:hypothetical protein
MSDHADNSPESLRFAISVLQDKVLALERAASATGVEITEEQVRAMVLADDMQTGHERCRHMLRAALAAGLGNGRSS